MFLLSQPIFRFIRPHLKKWIKRCENITKGVIEVKLIIFYKGKGKYDKDNIKICLSN